jgi:O-antigen biosynthesis protein
MSQRLSVAVVVCTASAEREALLRACVQSLIAGTCVPDQILVVVDQNPALLTGGLAADFANRGDALVTCDETEVTLRLERAYGQGRIRYVPAARAHHYVPAARIGWKPLVLRCVSEGLSKGRLHRLYRGAALGAERGYVRRVLVHAVPQLLVHGVLRRDRQSLLSGTAIVVSLLATAAAFVAGAAAAGRPEADLGPLRGTRHLHEWGR